MQRDYSSHDPNYAQSDILSAHQWPTESHLFDRTSLHGRDNAGISAGCSAAVGKYARLCQRQPVFVLWLARNYFCSAEIPVIRINLVFVRRVGRSIIRKMNGAAVGARAAAPFTEI